MAGNMLALDDDGFTVLGNALLLGYMWKCASHWSCNRPFPEYRWSDVPGALEAELIEAGERCELRDLLSWAGALGKWLDGEPVLGAWKLERFEEVSQRITSAKNSDEDFAKLRVLDIAFSEDQLAAGGLGRVLKYADSWEIRTSIAEVGPTDMTRILMKLVLAYFRDVRLGRDLITVPAASRNGRASLQTTGGPRPRAKIMEERRAIDALRLLHAASPAARLTKPDFRDALCKAEFGKRSQDRIWEAGAAEHWRIAGKPKLVAERISSDALFQELSKRV